MQEKKNILPHTKGNSMAWPTVYLYLSSSPLYFTLRFDFIFSSFRWPLSCKQRRYGKAALVYIIFTTPDLKGGEFYFLLLCPYHVIGKVMIGPVWIMNHHWRTRHNSLIEWIWILSSDLWVKGSAYLNIWKGRVSQRKEYMLD